MLTVYADILTTYMQAGYWIFSINSEVVTQFITMLSNTREWYIYTFIVDCVQNMKLQIFDHLH